MGPRLGVALGYVLVAVAFTWPLPLYLGTRLTGDPGGDTGVYVWNQWVFQHETAIAIQSALDPTDPVAVPARSTCRSTTTRRS